MNYEALINGNLVKLQITKMPLKHIETRLPKRHFDESQRFITERYETFDDLSNFFSTPIIKWLIRDGHMVVTYQNDYVVVEYNNKIYYYYLKTGMWFVDFNGQIEPESGSYFASSISRLVWDYILRDDAAQIKSSFTAKMKMIRALIEL
jgi:hypothetical protein